LVGDGRSSSMPSPTIGAAIIQVSEHSFLLHFTPLRL
jgi:hypothetical protein